MERVITTVATRPIKESAAAATTWGIQRGKPVSPTRTAATYATPARHDREHRLTGQRGQKKNYRWRS